MNRMCYGFLFCVVLASCSWRDTNVEGSSTGRAFKQDLRPLGKTMVYECNGYDFITRLGPGEMALWLEDRYVILSQVRAASGVRYEEGDTAFWMKGETASLTVDGQFFPDCRQSPRRVPWEDARRRGVDFRAVGNEPGWYLELQRGRQLLFVEDHGMRRVLIPDPVEETGEGVRSYHGVNGSDQLQVEVVERFCSDSMSGERYPGRVTVTLNGKHFSGCGRALDHPWK